MSSFWGCTIRLPQATDCFIISSSAFYALSQAILIRLSGSGPHNPGPLKSLERALDSLPRKWTFEFIFSYIKILTVYYKEYHTSLLS